MFGIFFFFRNLTSLTMAVLVSGHGLGKNHPKRKDLRQWEMLWWVWLMMELTRIVKLDLISLKTLNCLFSFGSTTFPLQGFIKKKNLPTSTSVTRVVEGGEPSDFKCLFRDWPQPPITGKVYSRNRVGKLHFSISNQLPVFICPQFETSLIMAIHSSVITLFVYSLLLAFHMFTFGDIVYNGDTHCGFCVVLGFFFTLVYCVLFQLRLFRLSLMPLRFTLTNNWLPRPRCLMMDPVVWRFVHLLLEIILMDF